MIPDSLINQLHHSQRYEAAHHRAEQKHRGVHQTRQHRKEKGEETERDQRVEGDQQPHAGQSVAQELVRHEERDEHRKEDGCGG